MIVLNGVNALPIINRKCYTCIAMVVFFTRIDYSRHAYYNLHLIQLCVPILYETM